MSKGRNYKGIEIFRVVAAFLVIAIHTLPLTTYSQTADFIFTRVIARVAVPFFFMVTGFFVLSKGTDVRRFLKKTAIIYAASAALYLPINVYAGHLQSWGILDLVQQVFFEGTFYHLWYLPAAILGAWLTWMLMRRLSSGACLAAVAVLYLLGLLGDSYWGLVENVPVISSVYNALFALMGYTRGGLFFASHLHVAGSSAEICQTARSRF